ncbi:hypothetical protein EBT31_15135, partial [bacterium]|nr:hypothetical protein [bacterium]
MAYNKDSMFDPVGVAALDPKVASYKKFIKDNLGQPDLLQFLQSDQGKKLDPNLAGAMIVLDQLEKARDNSPKGPAPTTSVVQDVGMAALQKAQQARMAMAPQQGIAQQGHISLKGALHPVEIDPLLVIAHHGHQGPGVVLEGQADVRP